MVFSYFVRYRVAMVGVMLKESLSASTRSRTQTFCKVSPLYNIHKALFLCLHNCKIKKAQKIVMFAHMSADLCTSGCHSELLLEGRADCRTMGHSAGCDRVSPGSVAHMSHCSLPAVLGCGAAAQSRL